MKIFLYSLVFFLVTISSLSSKAQTISFPEDPVNHNMHITSDGSFYYTINGGSSSIGQINKFTLNGTLVKTYPILIDGRGLTYNPADGYLYASVIGGSIVRITDLASGSFTTKFTSIMQDGQASFALSKDGSKFFDFFQGTCKIHDFNTGAVIKTITGLSYGPDNFGGESAIAVDLDHIYTWDATAKTVYIYNQSGVFMRTLLLNNGDNGMSLSIANGFIFVSKDGNYEIGTWYGTCIKANYTLDAQVTGLVNATCASTNGSVTIKARGGTPPFICTLAAGSFNDSRTFGNLAPGNYVDTITDQSGCSIDTIHFTIAKASDVPKLVITNPKAVCSGSNVDITSSAISTGSDPGLRFSYWTNPAATLPLTNPSAVNAAGTYYIKGENASGCADIKTVVVTIIAAPAGTISPKNDTTLCSGNSVSLTVTATGSNSYSWYRNNTLIPNANSATYAASSEGIYRVDINNGVCTQSAINTVNVKIGNIDNSISSSALTVCAGTGVKLDAVQNAQYKYQWFKDDIAIPGATMQTYTTTFSGHYKAQISNAATGCMAFTKSLFVHIIGKPIAGFNGAAIYCAGSPTDFLNTSKPPDDNTALGYLWDFGDGASSTSGSHTFKTAGTYTVRLTASIATAGCNSSDTISKTVKVTAVEPGVKYNDVIVSPGRPYSLSARPNIGNKYLWSPAGPLNDANSRTPLVTTAGDQSFKITITASSGCTTVDEQTVLVARPSSSTTSNADSIVVVPTAFTPNANGMNDRLRPIPYNIDKLTYFKVYNRWGQLIYETKILGEGWDGTLKTKQQPSETYTWILECTTLSGKKIRQSGRSLLIR